MIRNLIIFAASIAPTAVIHWIVLGEWRLILPPTHFMDQAVSLWAQPFIWLAITLIVLASVSFASTLFYALKTRDAEGTFVFGLFFVSIPVILALVIFRAITPVDIDSMNAQKGIVAMVQPSTEHLASTLEDIQRYVQNELVPLENQLRRDKAILRDQLLGMGVRTTEDVKRDGQSLPLAIELLEVDRAHREVRATIDRYEVIGRELQSALRRSARLENRPKDFLGVDESLALRATIRVLNEESWSRLGLTMDDIDRDFERVLNRDAWR